MSEDTLTKIAVMQNDINYIKEHQENNRKEAERRHGELLEAIQQVADSKAGKWVERVVAGFIIMILTAFAGFLISIAIKQ